MTWQLTKIIFVCSHTYICLPARIHFFIVWLFFPDKGYGCTGYGPYGTWLIHVWHDSLRWDMTHSCARSLIHTWHDLFMCMTRFIHVRHDSFTRDMTHVCVTGLYRVSLTHSYVIRCIHVWHDAFTRDLTHSCVTCLIGVSQTKHTTAFIFFRFVGKQTSLMQAGELQYVFEKK